MSVASQARVSRSIDVRAPVSRGDFAWAERMWGMFLPSPASVRIAFEGSERRGATAFRAHASACEVLALGALDDAARAALLDDVERECAAMGRARLEVRVPGDDIDALRFYLRHELRVTGVRRGGGGDCIALEKRLAVAVPTSPDVAFW
jgi:hypothetical protein